MSTNNDDIKWLYGKLKAKGYNVGTEQEFTSSLANEADRQWYYEKAKGMGLNMGSMADFNGLYAPQTAKSPAASAPGPQATKVAPAQTSTPSQAAPDSAAKTPAQPAAAPAPQHPQQPAWHPTEQDKIRTSYQLDTMLNNFIQRSKARVAQFRRSAEPLTTEGRKKRADMKILAGTDTTAGANLKAPTDPVDDGGTPQPYGMKYVDGKPVTEWVMPDGSLTTNPLEVSQAEDAARTNRLRHQFEGRMKKNGLDPAKPEDIEKQAILDRLDDNRRRQLEKDMEVSQNAAEDWAWDDNAGFFDNLKRLVSHSIMRSEGVQFGSEIKEESDADMHNMKAENYMLSKALTRLNAGNLRKSSGILGGMLDVGNNLKNFGAGVADAASDENLYIGGMADYNAAKQLMDIDRKLRNGQQLTESDKNLVYATMLNMKAEQQANVPYMYSAASTIVDMAPFMLEMMSNPGSGLSKSIARKFGKSAIKRFTANVAGDVTEAAILTGTIQSPKTISDAMRRFVGDPVMNENGKVTGFNGDHDALKSFAKAEGASVIENYTELLGSHFGVIGNYLGKGISNGAKKVGLGNVVENTSELISRISSTDWAKGISNIERRAQWNGTLGEIAEEEAGIVLNSLFVGDNSLSDLVDKKQQIDIALGVGLFGGFVSGIKTGGYLLGKRRASSQLQKTDERAASGFGDKWQGMRSAIDDAEDKDISEVVMQQITDNAETPEQADMVARYAHSLMRARGYNLAGAERATEAMDNPKAAEVLEKQTEAENQYEQGRELYGRYEEGDMAVQADVDAIALRMQEAYQVFDDAFGPEAEYYMACIEDPHLTEEQRASAPWELLDDPELTVERKDAVLYYINAKAALDGVMDASNEVADRKREEVKQSVKKRTHKVRGVIIPATMKVDDRPVYIVKGDVVMFPDGKSVDVRNSSESVVVMDAQTGEYQFKSPDWKRRARLTPSGTRDLTPRAK